MSPSLRVAAKFVQAAYFEVGSVVLYGKWKNHKGKIIKIDQDKWGNPTIEIEPMPKGRKKNKVMGLFKVWRADVKEKAMKEMEKEEVSKEAKVVVAKYLVASGVPLGKTFNVGSLRIHRYRDHFKMWDLTNAGKRGKKVKVMTLSPSNSYKGDSEAWMENMSKALPSHRSYDEVVKLVKDLQADYPYEISMNEYEERGIDVDPIGEKLTLKTDTGLDIKAEPKEFLINSSYTFKGKDDKPGIKQDTLYYSRDPKSAGIFYAWLKSNLSKINKMDISGLRKVWDELGVKYDYH